MEITEIIINNNNNNSNNLNKVEKGNYIMSSANQSNCKMKTTIIMHQVHWKMS